MKVENLNLKVSKVEDSGEVTHRPLHGCIVKNRCEIEQRFACFSMGLYIFEHFTD